MALSRNRKTERPGSPPGLTPIDDIHGGQDMPELDPDGTTGRLPDRQGATEGNQKRRRSSSKKKTSKS